MAPPRWLHTDDEAEKQAVLALASAKNKEWGVLTSIETHRRLRSLMAMTAQATYLSSAKPAKGSYMLPEYAGYGEYETQERLEIASIVARTPLLMLPKDYAEPAKDVWTVNGKDPLFYMPDDNVSIPPLVIVGLVVFGVSAVCAAMVKIAGDKNQVVDRELTRNADTRQMVASQGKALELIGAHVKREDDQKKTIPYSVEERETLAALLDAQKKVAERRQEPLPSPFQGATDTLSNAAGAVKEGAKGALEELSGAAVPLAVAAVVAFKVL